MSSALATSFGHLLDALSEYLNENWAWPCPQSAFCNLVYDGAAQKSPLVREARMTWPSANEMRNAPTLAACGYVFASRLSPPPEWASHWASELSHLLEREPFPIDRQSFAFRPTEVLGIVIGAAKCAAVTDELRRRVSELIQELPAKGNQDEFSTGIYAFAAKQLGIHWTRKIEGAADSLPVPVLALLKWYSINAPGFEEEISRTNVKEIDAVLLTRCATQSVGEEDVAQVALIHCSLSRCVSETIQSLASAAWPRNRESADSIQIVEQVCRRFHLFARQLQDRRHDVAVEGEKKKKARPTIEMKDEYDVQDALFAILKIFFDDIRAEEWAPSYAGGQSRMDFVLKRERIVIETKFVGPRLSQAEVVKQLTIDEKYYRQAKDCDTLICFVYDPELRCENPTALEGDVSNSDEGFQLIAIVGPKGM